MNTTLNLHQVRMRIQDDASMALVRHDVCTSDKNEAQRQRNFTNSCVLLLKGGEVWRNRWGALLEQIKVPQQNDIDSSAGCKSQITGLSVSTAGDIAVHALSLTASALQDGVTGWVRRRGAPQLPWNMLVTAVCLRQRRRGGGQTMVSDGCKKAMHDKPHSNQNLTHRDNESHTCCDCKPTHSKHTHRPDKGAIVDDWRPLSRCLLKVKKHTAPPVCVCLHVCIHMCQVSVLKG